MTEDHKGRARNVPTIGTGDVRADDQIVVAIAVHVACSGDIRTQAVSCLRAVDPDAVRRVQMRKVKRRAEATHLAVDQIGRAVSAEQRIRGRGIGADDEVGDAVAVHIAGARDRDAVRKTGADPVGMPGIDDVEAGGAVERAEIDLVGERAGMTVDDIGTAALAAAHDEIIDAVAVHVTGRTHPETGFPIVNIAVDAEAVGAVEAGERRHRGIGGSEVMLDQQGRGAAGEDVVGADLARRIDLLTGELPGAVEIDGVADVVLDDQGLLPTAPPDMSTTLAASSVSDWLALSLRSITSMFRIVVLRYR